ncbi:hypothetical protein BDC45DRAFT_565629 [Circinella umbellata]|nr:hypothetical protein BDC45DRAFT_565629 [Circinella umbellata]
MANNNNNKALIPRPKNNNLAKLPVAKPVSHLSSTNKTQTMPSKQSQQPQQPQPQQQRNNYTGNKKKNNNKNKNAPVQQQATVVDSSQAKQFANKKQDWKNNNNNIINNKPSKYNNNPSSSHRPNNQQYQQRRQQVMPVKARRVERKKDIVSMQDALRKSQVDLLSTSPVSSSGESENDSDSGFQSRRRNRRASNDGGQVYCGPCFSNAPAPSALPMPPALSSHNPDHDGMFMMDDLQQQSKELMSLLMPSHRIQNPSMTTMAMNSNIPPRMQTAHSLDNDLSEIQRGLRSMLKMSS